MATYYRDYPIFLTDAGTCASAQGSYPEGIAGAPDDIAIAYAAPINPAPPTFGEGQCIWTGSIDSALPTSVASVVIPPNFIYAPDNSTPILAFPGAPGGTLEWRGHFVRRGGTGPITKEPLQTHRWMVGFERANFGEGSSGAAGQQFSRDASRTIEGLGLAMRSPANLVFSMAPPQTGTGNPPRYSWERIYVRLRTYPTANEMFWGCKGSIESGTAALLLVSSTGNILINNKGNQSWPGTNVTSAGTLPLNKWVKLDLLVNFKATGGAGSLLVFVNGVLTGEMRGNAAGTIGGSGGLLNQVQTHSSSRLGNENTPTNGMDIDYDDWTNKTQPQLFTGDDWLAGTHVQPLALTGFDGANHSPSWTGAFQTLDGVPVNGQQDFVTSSVAGITMAVTTDYQDRQAGCSGMQFSLFSKTASSTTEQLGYSINGAAAVLQDVTTSSAAWAAPGSTDVTQILYSAGGQLTAPVLGSVSVLYKRDAAATNREINVLNCNAEYIGIWGSEDPINSTEQTASPPRQGPHNSPYYEGMFGQTAFDLGLGVVEVMSGTYVGNGTGQDITMQMPAHWIWIRPLTSGTGGGRWFSSMLGGHDPLKETPDKENLIRCYQTTNTSGPNGYKFRVSGTLANSNNTGVVYQWVAFSDRGMRFCLNGAYLTLGGTTSFNHPLFDGSFTPTAGFLLPEIGTNVSTKGMYFKGPGHATNAASIMDAALSASVCAFGAGSITPKTILNLDSSQTAYSLWRATDGSGVSGPVAIATYTGDGSGARNIALSLGGRSPIFAIVQPADGVAYVRDPSHTGSNSTPINSPTADTAAITGGAANQITVGATLNVNTTVYSVFALAGDVASGWNPNPSEPIPTTDPIPPVPGLPPASLNGWWMSDNLFTGNAAVSIYPPSNPRDARDWQKLSAFATGNAGFYAGFPAPGVTVNNFFIYAGNDYQVGSTQPTIRIFDGLSDRLMITVPDVAGVKTIAIIAMLAVNGKIYFTTLDSGTSASDYAGRVFEFDPDALTLVQIGAQFVSGEVPYALCWHMGRLFLGTNKGSGAAAKIYWFRVGIDTAWTVDYTITSSSVGGCTSLASYKGLLYVGCNATAAMGTNKILVRDTAGAYTTSFTLTSGGTFRASNAVPAMVVFNDKLFASFWNPDTVPDCYLKRFDGTAWTTVYTGSGGTVRPFSGLFVAKNTLFIVGGGSGLSACLVRSSDGNAFTDVTAFLEGPQNTVTAMPIIAQIGV